MIRQITEKILQLYNSGKCIFPISDIIYYETMKQGDVAKRSASIALLDQYSEGLAIVTAVHKFQIAFGHWIRKHLKINNLTSPKESAWSAINLVIGFPGFVKQAENLSDELQNSFFYFASKITLSDIHKNTVVPFKPFNGKDVMKGRKNIKFGIKHFLECFIPN